MLEKVAEKGQKLLEFRKFRKNKIIFSKLQHSGLKFCKVIHESRLEFSKYSKLLKFLIKIVKLNKIQKISKNFVKY